MRCCSSSSNTTVGSQWRQRPAAHVSLRVFPVGLRCQTNVFCISLKPLRLLICTYPELALLSCSLLAIGLRRDELVMIHWLVSPRVRTLWPPVIGDTAVRRHPCASKHHHLAFRIVEQLPQPPNRVLNLTSGAWCGDKTVQRSEKGRIRLRRSLREDVKQSGGYRSIALIASRS